MLVFELLTEYNFAKINWRDCMPNLLIEAIKNNDYDSVFELLNQNPGRNRDILNHEYVDEQGFVQEEVSAIPLHLATFLLNPALVALLLEQGADPNFESENFSVIPLDYAIYPRNLLDSDTVSNQIEIIDTLYYYGAKINEESLDKCITRSGDYGKLDSLLMQNNNRIIESLAQKYILNDLLNLIRSGDVQKVSNVLSKAIYIKHPYQNIKLCKFRIDLNADGGVYGKAIMFAAELETPAMLQLLFGKGAKLDVVDAYGSNVFHYAARYGRLKNIEWLSQRLSPQTRKLLINSPDNIYGNTPLHLAVKYNHVKTVEKLLSLGANKEIKNQKEFTAENQPGVTRDVKAIFEVFTNGKIPTLQWMCIKAIVKQNLPVHTIKFRFPAIDERSNLAKTGKLSLDSCKRRYSI